MLEHAGAEPAVAIRLDVVLLVQRPPRFRSLMKSGTAPEARNVGLTRPNRAALLTHGLTLINPADVMHHAGNASFVKRLCNIAAVEVHDGASD